MPPAQVQFEERVNNMQIGSQYFIVHSAFTYAPACHQEAVLHVQLNRAGQSLGKSGTTYIKESILASGIGKHWNARVCAQHPAGKKRSVCSAGDIESAVFIPARDLAQAAFHR